MSEPAGAQPDGKNDFSGKDQAVAGMKTPGTKKTFRLPSIHIGGFWIGMLGMAALLAALGYWAWRLIGTYPAIGIPQLGGPAQIRTEAVGTEQYELALPSAEASGGLLSNILRSINLQTTIPARNPDWVSQYTVQKGDSVESIAKQFGLKDDTIVWGNTDLLAKDANFLQPGQTLVILPVDGAFYKWKAGDSLEGVADTWNITAEAILDWPGNDLNPLSPTIMPGQWLILPGGWKQFDWQAAVVRTGKSTTYALGAGMCQNGLGGPIGTGDWFWPTPPGWHWLSGNTFLGSAHPGIDIAARIGLAVYAADNGVIVYAGWSQNRDGTPGYGNLVIIDHLDGWHTFYGHLSQINVTCGQSVYGGNIIGLAGSTGNSTGPHVHFEMRYNNVPQDPLGILPAS
jgi:murein DD-endopeptidase MepM/ murein hydrolase activator NlpD